MMYIILFLCSVFISSVSQVLLKSSANQKYENKLKEYLNPRVLGSYLLFFGATLTTVMAYRYVPLSLGGILESIGYIFVAILSYVFLREKISKSKMIGLVMILIGVMVFNV